MKVFKDIEDNIDFVEEFINNYDFSIIIEKFNILKYIIPVPTNWECHSDENWDELEEDEELHWIIPNEDIVSHLLLCKIVNMYWEEYYESVMMDIKIILNDKNIIFDLSELDNQIQELKELEKEWKYDHDNILPTKKYVGNCSKEFCEKIVEKYWEREYYRIQYIAFPPLSFKQISLKNCEDEFKRLQNEIINKSNSKNYSNIIKYFHKSIIFANVGKSLSPYDGWNYIQDNEEAFKDFYRNRLRCSDWFKGEGKLPYLLRGVVMEETYGIGLSTSRKYQLVTYFKPRLAKYIITKYLNEYDTIFDPFSGYSGRMIGCLACNKNYIGQDLCEMSINESKEIYEFLKQFTNNTCQLSIKDSIKSSGKYDCLFTCSPYGDIEKWPGVKPLNYSCDKWIDICLQNYKCNKYVFVTDNKIEKYKDYIVETLQNTSHLATNYEYIIVINKEDLKNIHLDINYGNTIEYNECNNKEFSNIGIHLYNIFNKEIFDNIIDCPINLTKWIDLIYNKFNQEIPIINNIELNKIKLNNIDNKVLLACSGGLDSIYQIFQLKDMGYDPILFHLKHVNMYENGQSYNTLKEFIDDFGIKMICPTLKHIQNSNYVKYWAENPIKNQMIMFLMIDYCKENNINKICMDGSWEFPIKETTCGIDVADAPENYKTLLECLSNYVENLEFIKTEHPSKIDKIKFLDNKGLMKYVYSCLGPGKFNEYRHNEIQKKYNIELFEHNCGCYCRKCAHHNLLMHYSKYKEFPKEFINRCWNIMSDNSFKSRAMLFDKSIPLEKRIENLFIE